MSGNSPSASRKYTPVREGSIRNRRCTVRGLGEDVVNQLAGQVAGQLAEMPGSEHPGRDSHRPGQSDRRGDVRGMAGEGRGRLRAQRDLWTLGKIVKGPTDLPGAPSPN